MMINKKDRKIWRLLMDLNKAFDSINRSLLFEHLLEKAKRKIKTDLSSRQTLELNYNVSRFYISYSTKLKFNITVKLFKPRLEFFKELTFPSSLQLMI